MGILSADIDHRQERDDFSSEYVVFLKTPGSEAEKNHASGKPEMGSAAGRSCTRVSNLLR